MLALRNHPLINDYGIRSWPPVWVNTRSKPSKKLAGEIGFLVGTVLYPANPKRLFLKMELEQERYMGCIVLSEAWFCQQLDGILKNHIGQSIKEIGDLDVSHTL